MSKKSLIYLLIAIITFLSPLSSLGPVLTAKNKINPKSKAFPSPVIKEKVDILFKKSMKEADQGEYVKSLATIDEIITLTPGHPIGYLFSAAVMQWVIQNYRNYDLYNEKFFKSIDHILNNAKKLNRLNAWRYIYLGGAYGFRGIQHSVLGNFFSAFHDGLRGVNRMKTALKLDDTIYDAYYGLGTYIFWKAYYTDQFFFLTGDPKLKDVGINYILQCITKCNYTQKVAERALVIIYRIGGRINDSIDLANKILARTPVHIGLRRALGRNYFDLKQYSKALTIFKKTKELLKKNQLTHVNAIVEINYYLAKTYAALKETNKVNSLFQESKVLFPKTNKDIKPVLDIVKNFENLYEKINNK